MGSCRVQTGLSSFFFFFFWSLPEIGGFLSFQWTREWLLGIWRGRPRPEIQGGDPSNGLGVWSAVVLRSHGLLGWAVWSTPQRMTMEPQQRGVPPKKETPEIKYGSKLQAFLRNLGAFFLTGSDGHPQWR